MSDSIDEPKVSRVRTSPRPSPGTSDRPSEPGNLEPGKTAIAASGAASTSENFRKFPIFRDRGNSEVDAPPQVSAAPATPPAAPPARPVPLNARQAAALALLIAGKPLAGVAKEIGITLRTLYAWRKEPQFAAEMKMRAIEAMDAGAIRACDLMMRSSALVGESLRTPDRYKWAFRVMNSKRMWDLCQQMPDAKLFAQAVDGLADQIPGAISGGDASASAAPRPRASASSARA